MFNIYTRHLGLTHTLPFKFLHNLRRDERRIQNESFKKTERWEGKMIVAGGCWIIKDKKRRWHRPASSHQITQVHQEAQIWIMHKYNTHTHTQTYFHIITHILYLEIYWWHCASIIQIQWTSCTVSHPPTHTHTHMHKGPSKYSFTHEPAYH